MAAPTGAVRSTASSTGPHGLRGATLRKSQSSALVPAGPHAIHAGWARSEALPCILGKGSARARVAAQPGDAHGVGPTGQSDKLPPASRVGGGVSTAMVGVGKVGVGCQARQWEGGTLALCSAGVGGSQGVGSEC